MTNIYRIVSIKFSRTPLTMTLPKLNKAIFAKERSNSTDVIQYVDIETPQITGPHDVIIKNKYAGVNFIEVYFRKGLFPAQFPFVFGTEASGVVTAVGDLVTKFKVGDKVAYMAQLCFAQYTKIQDSLVHVKVLPADTTESDLKLWAASLLQGLTVIPFIEEAYKVNAGDYILVWAASGGTGQLLTNLAAKRGAKVIAVASSDEKLAVAKSLGAQYLVRTDEDVVAKVREITGGVGVNAVYDSIGRDTFEISLQTVARKGTFVSYGLSSGPVPPFDILRLSEKNIKMCFPLLFQYIATPEEWTKYTDILHLSLKSGDLKISYCVSPLSDYKKVTEAVEARKTTGKSILEIPE